ncbi:MAG: type I-B CRISPR-associated protein Cas8b1/Cst1 [Deltaproteobacteria bacterium]|nr:type I-B CRISPR-associated protein Cas8b1/Cst1 [Deltaproteobacteria bacterium]
MRHKVYMRDWYFNAGIIGFLATLSDWNTDPKSIEGVKVGENFIEFENEVLEDFTDNFLRRIFFLFFKKRAYLNKIEGVLKELQDKKVKNPYSKIKNIEEKGQYKRFLTSLNLLPKQEIEEKEEVIKLAEHIIAEITGYSDLTIYNKILNGDENALSYFVGLKLKGVSSYKNIEKYIKKISNIKEAKIKNNLYCLSCQQRKASEDFSNSISNLIGVNTDNKNWVWGYKDTKTKVCPVCALIYQCAVIAFAYTLKKKDNNWLNFFYFINCNSSVSDLYESVASFRLLLKQQQDKPLYAMIQESVRLIQSEQIKDINGNVNFIEMADNPILSGQSTKGYNLYNYNIDKKTAEFLNKEERFDKLKKIGGYIIKKDYYDVGEELLLLTVKKQIGFLLLNGYFQYYVSSSVKIMYNLYRISEHILSYIRFYKEASMQEKIKKISKKGFGNGRDLRRKLKSEDNLNQVEGIVYRFLNDLKISDRDKFLDKYIRIMMRHKMDIRFGQNELLDTDDFLTFGYSFINGLLYKEYEKKDNESNKKGDN